MCSNDLEKGRPEADVKRLSAAARTPCPGRRRRPSGAQHLDTVEHGGSLAIVDDGRIFRCTTSDDGLSTSVRVASGASRTRTNESRS